MKAAGLNPAAFLLHCKAIELPRPAVLETEQSYSLICADIGLIPKVTKGGSRPWNPLIINGKRSTSGAVERIVCSIFVECVRVGFFRIRNKLTSLVLRRFRSLQNDDHETETSPRPLRSHGDSFDRRSGRSADPLPHVELHSRRDRQITISS